MSEPAGRPEEPGPPAVVVVNHDAGDALIACVASLRAEGVAEVVVVDNASTDGSVERLEAEDAGVHVIRAGANLGYGAGVNRGLADVEAQLVLVSNPDVAVHPGSLAVLARAIDGDPLLAIAGPCILEPDGRRYPSARRFPSWVDAAGHALLGTLAPTNPFTKRYRMSDLDPTVVTNVDWVSGACFLARRGVLDELGGFDEGYFMYAEDVDLCWRAHRAGYTVAYVPTARVTHIQGLSTRRRPYRMLLAHHRSAYRFASRTTRGWRRWTLPAVAGVLALRFAAAVGRQAVAPLY
ncbi:MAG: glycosyltransferase family 2 protein, partial [Acidimicrobiales bacterium]